MNYTQVNRPLRMNMDKAHKMLSEEEAFYLLNHEKFVNINGKKSASGKTTPSAANYPACGMEQPAGENYSVGVYRSPITNELYSWHFNSNGIYYILRISGTQGCQVVYTGDISCLPLSAEPENFIAQWRAYLKVDRTCKNQHGKQLIWTDGLNNIGQIDVEASIATNSFETPFFERCSTGCEMTQMCVPKLCACITAKFVPPTIDDASLANHIVDTPFKFIYRHIYYDGRASEYSDISPLYFQDSKGCFDTTAGFSRCMNLRVPIGNPLVEKIEIGFNKGGDTWFTTEIVEKYESYNSAQQFWYERDLSKALASYSDSDCSFDYLFCNDKQCDTIDPHLIADRVYNPMPRQAQGLIPIKNALGFYNYIKGTCPIDKSEVDKIDVDLDCADQLNCVEELATVTVRAIVHNYVNGSNQFVYRLGAGGTDDITDTARFGGLNYSDFLFGLFGGVLELGYDQEFGGTARNFIAYVEGTDIWGEMKQWHSDKHFVRKNLIGIVPDMNTKKTQKSWDSDIDSGNFFYQEYIFKVKKGTKGFIRLASHHQETGIGDAQNTSTFVLGTIPDIRGYNGNPGTLGQTTYNKYEIYFDTCNGNVELFETFVIDDNATDAALSKKTSAFNGYIRDMSGAPVEGVIVKWANNNPLGLATDHNGFYHFYAQPGVDGAANFDIWAETNSGDFASVKTFTVSGILGDNVATDEIVDLPAYQTHFYANVKVTLVDCNNIGIGGVRIALSGSKYGVTNAQGIATIKIRNYQPAARTVRAVVMDEKGCFYTDCSGICNPCMPDISGTAPRHFSNIFYNPIVTLPTMIMNKDSVFDGKRGLKNGGRYGFGFVVEWPCDKITDVMEIKYINIPKAQQSGNIKYCGLKYDATKNGTMNLPSDASCLKIVRTVNKNPFELQWIVDKIERVSGDKIKLTIQSLNDYNAQYNFKTNTGYGYLKGDRVEFIRNGDGTILNSAQGGVLNYLTLSPFHDMTISGQKNAPVDYFNQLLIEDDGRLTNITAGAVIEIQRQQDCSTIPAYYEICASIPIINGRLQYEKGNFTTFDSYIVHRTIGSNPPQIFEHFSPSDFWGERIGGRGVDDAGKPHIVNKYENQKRVGRNITINAPDQFNYFGDMEKTFDAPEQGDITAMNITDGSIIIAIGEHDNFLAQAADNLIRVGSDGTVRALPPDSIIGSAEPKLKGQYGCQYPHIGSIYFGDAYATWFDVNKTKFIKHNYTEAKAVCEGVVETFFRTRAQEIETHNRQTTDPLDKYRFATGINRNTDAIYLTTKTLRQSGINNEIEPFKQPNDTIVYHPETNEWLGFASHTPEAYGHIDLFDGSGCAFISYLYGFPYIHPIIPTKFNEFYGIAVDRIIGISLNKNPDKIKVGLAIEVQDDVMWFSPKVITDKSNFLSEIPPVKWKQKENKWNAAFLFNINSRGGLFGENKNVSGERPRGYNIDIILKRDNTDLLKYNSVNNEKRIIYDELDLILFKFMISEQSGFSENL